MENYPEKTESFTFELEILEPVVIEAAIVSFAPVLITDVSESFSLEAGEPWSLFLDATDPDNDLATIDVTFSGTSADWIQFDQESLTVSTIDNLVGAQTLGTFQITVVLEDLTGKRTDTPVTLEVICPAGSEDPLCYVEPEISDDDVSTDDGEFIDPDATTIDSITSQATFDDFTADYEVVEVVSIAE